MGCEKQIFNFAAFEAESDIGFSESIRLVNNRISRTDIKSTSFSDQDGLPHIYVDAAAFNSKV